MIPGGIFGTVVVTSSVRFHFSHPEWLILLPVAAVWTLGWARRSDSSLAPRRLRWALALRLAGLLVLVLALAGLQWRRPDFGMNLFFLLDRSDSVPGAVQEQARQLANRWAREKPETDKGGFLVFGSEAALETTATSVAEAERIQTVVPTDRTDIAAAIRLGTAAFPEQGQRRLVLLSDGNENVGDGLAAIRSARSLGVDLDVVALGSRRGEDLSVQKVEVPASVKQGQAFDVRLVVGTEQARTATVRLYRDNRAIAEQEVVLEPGRNLLSVPQKLDEPGFHAYEVVVDAPGDTVAQNNRASGFVQIRGDPRILVVSSDPEADRFLVQALRAARLEVRVVRETELPSTLAEIQSHDAIVLGNVSAGDLGPDGMRLLESAVRDFGVGLVCIGGDQSFAAGGYRSTPLEEALPLDMELSSRKVLPKGALGLVMHGMEIANGNQVAREIALAALDALGPTDEMGVWLWDGTEKPLFPLQSVGSKTALA
ncbi:MAG: VWA domain-containing protein, partial [Verrucomicrobiota bacterium]